MSIIKYEFNESGASADALSTFLQNHKTNTFLSDCSISLNSNNYGHCLKFTQTDTNRSGNKNVFSLKTCNGNYATNTFTFEYQNSGGYNIWSRSDSSTISTTRRIKDILFCNNGFILRYTLIIASSTYYRSILILTKDSNGNLAWLQADDPHTETSMVPSSYVVGSNRSQSPASISMSGVRYGCNRTCLAPVAIPISSEPELYLPNVWIAHQTQLSGTGLNAVRINGVDYITNGGIYIRDTPSE